MGRSAAGHAGLLFHEHEHRLLSRSRPLSSFLFFSSVPSLAHSSPPKYSAMLMRPGRRFWKLGRPTIRGHFLYWATCSVSSYQSELRSTAYDTHHHHHHYYHPQPAWMITTPMSHCLRFCPGRSRGCNARVGLFSARVSHEARIVAFAILQLPSLPRIDHSSTPHYATDPALI